MTFDINQTLTKPVYDVADYGQTIMIPLVQDSSLTLKTITPSTSTFFQDSPSSTVFTIDDINQVLSDIDEISIAHEGNNTAFNRIYQWQPESYGVVYKTNLIAAFGVNVSAFSSGSIDLDSVQIILSSHLPDGTLIDTIFDKTVAATLTALTATGTLIFIMDLEHAKPFEIKSNNPIRMQIIINETVSGTNTRQVGILPLFCFNSEATNKIFTTSVLKFHIHPDIKNAYMALRTVSTSDEIDYSGVDKDGVHR